MLLDVQEAQSTGLFEQISLLTENAAETAQKIVSVEEEVSQLEREALRTLQENERWVFLK